MTTYQLLMYGAIRKDMGNGHRFYGALKAATIEDLQRVQAKLERYSRYPQTHQAQRLALIKRELTGRAQAKP